MIIVNRKFMTGASGSKTRNRPTLLIAPTEKQLQCDPRAVVQRRTDQCLPGHVPMQ
jgi:hypothetical protein